MHDIDRIQAELEADSLEPEAEDTEAEDYDLEAEDLEGGDDREAGPEGEAPEGESPFSEGEELELATELIGISDEGELDQFLGGLLKKAWRTATKVAPGLNLIAPQLGGILKGVAGKLLPVAAGAAGTFLGGPVGGALGAKLGSLASQALQGELAGLGAEDREFETARRLVRLAGSAATRAAAAPPGADPYAVARSAVAQALRWEFRNGRPARGGYLRPAGYPGYSGYSGFAGYGSGGAAGQPAHRRWHARRGRRGHWVRKGDRIILYGVW